MSPTSREARLKAMGIETFRLRDAQSAEDPAPEAAAVSRGEPMADPAAATVARRAREPQAVPAPGSRESPANLDWTALEAAVSGCTLCALCETRTQAVFGTGKRDAALMIIGEAPGADEDRLGEPFVGRAGKLLDLMLRSIGFARSDVYIANILKCRPPRNRDPLPGETARCTPYLERQIELVAPRAVLAVGRIAAQHLLQSDLAIGRLRGRVSRLGSFDVPIVVTYHPAYLLRSPREKAKAWQDLCLVRRLITD